MAIVYTHIRKDTNEIFYVGIGKTIARSKSKNNRNKYWHNIVNKVGYDIEIIHNNISWEEACELEKFYIKQYGRKDLGLGLLVNLTDGGEGICNVSLEARKKISESAKGEKNPMYGRTNEKNPMYGKKHSEESIKKISESSIGKTYSEESIKKMSESKMGEKHPNSKLTEEDVKWIRENYIPKHPEFGGRPLSKKFGVGERQISRIINYELWKNPHI